MEAFPRERQGLGRRSPGPGAVFLQSCLLSIRRAVPVQRLAYVAESALLSLPVPV